MAKVLILYYSAYGHIEKMAEAVAEGARAVPGTEVTVKRVPELVPAEIASRPWTSSRTTTLSSSERPRASGTCARRCATSSTKPAATG